MTSPAAAGGRVGEMKGWDEVAAWSIKAESEGVPVDGSEGIRIGYFVHRVVAASSANRLYYFCGHQEDDIGSDWRNEPWNVELTLSEQRLCTYHVFNRQVEFSELPSGEKIPAPIGSDVMFLFLPVWPLSGYSAPHDESSGLIGVVGAALASADYEATSKRQLFDSEWCAEYTLLNGNDRLWVSEDKDLCLMRREWYDPKTHAKLGEIVTKKIAEVSPGLWMPVEVDCIRYLPTGVGSESVAKGRTVTRVTDWSFGDEVPANTFAAALKPGTIDLMGPGRFRQISAGGMEHLDEAAAFFRGPLGLPRPTTAEVGWLRGTTWVTVGIIGGWLIGMILFLPGAKSRRKMSRNCESTLPVVPSSGT